MNRSVLFHVFGALLLAAHASLAFAQSEGERRVRIEITRNENGSESHVTREFDLNDQQQLADALRELGVMDELNVIGDDENLVIDLKRMRDGGMLNDMSMALSMADAEAASTPRAYLGVYYGDWNESCDKAEKKKGPPVKEGACVTAVEDGTPADKAGLKEGDVIVMMDDRKIGSGGSLLDAIQDHKPGDSVKVTFYRGKEKKSVSATLTAKEDDEEAPDYNFNFDWGQSGEAHERAMKEFANAFKAEENGAFLGVDGEDMPDGGGVRITNVVDSSAAELMGLKEGDIITSINDEKIEDFEDLADLMDETDPNSDAQVHVKRDDPDKPGTASELTINGKLGQRKTIAWNWDGDMGGPVVAPMPPMPMMPRLNGSAMSPEDKEQYERDMEQYQTDMEQHDRDMEEHDRDMEEHNRDMQEQARDQSEQAQDQEGVRREMDELRREMDRLRRDLRGEVTREIRVTVDAVKLSKEESEVLTKKGVTSLDNSLDLPGLRVSPNPSVGSFDLAFQVPERGDLNVDVHDNNGDRVYHESITGFKGNYERVLDMSDRASGTYFVVITQNGKAQARKLVKQ